MAILQQVRHTVRSLLRTPGFTVISVLVLALGIGANTAIFSVMNAVLLRPLPFPDAGQLVELLETSAKGSTWSVSYPDFVDWRNQAQVFENIAITSNWPATLAGDGDAEKIELSYVSGSFLRTLKTQPALGRDFLPGEDRKGGPAVLVISYGFWQRRLGGDPAAIGKTLTLDREPYTIVGVLPQSFRYHRASDMYTPFARCIDSHGMEVRGNHNNSWVVARMKPGVTLEQTQAQMDGIAGRLAAAYPATNTGTGARARALRDVMVGRSRTFVFVLFGAVAFVLLIACANVANLLLARSAVRRKELAIRVTLGATRARLVVQLLIESVVLAVAGGVLGLFVADTSFQALVRLLPRGFEAGDIRIDATVLGFSFLVSLLTGIVFGLAPAMQISRAAISEGLKEGGRQTAGTMRTRLRSALVVAEVAMALVLLAGAGLLMRSFYQLMRIDTGFNPEHVLSVEFSWPSNPWASAPQLVAFQRDLVERVRTMPGVRSAGGVWPLPFGGGGAFATFYLEGKPVPERGKLPTASQHVATPEYFGAMGIPLLKGRMFTAADGTLPQVSGLKELMQWFQSAQVSVVINAAMARRDWPGEDPVGKRFRWGTPDRPGPLVTVVGVVGDSRDAALDNAAEPRFYLSAYQMPRMLSLVVRTEGDPAALAGQVRSAVKALNPGVPVTRVRTMEQVVSDSMSSRRSNMLLLAVFAALAVALAAIGIYGVIGYTVSQRSHEFGVRMALGAARSSVLSMVVGHAALLAVTGVAIGIAGALALTRLLRSMLFGIEATDPATFVAVSAFLIGVALVASYVPARRATRVDPAAALRQE